MKLYYYFIILNIIFLYINVKKINKLIFKKNLKIEEINYKYCNNNTCKFLLPIFIGEQETKAQIHFQQLAFLSGKLKEKYIIVLPNIDNSYFGACKKYNFEEYYSIEHIKKYTRSGYYKYITMNNFNKWINEYNKFKKPISQNIFILEKNTSNTNNYKIDCFKNKQDILEKDIIIYNKNIIETLNKIENIEILNIIYDRRHTFINDKIIKKHLPYNRYIYDTVSNINNNISFNIAVHWRMENIKPTYTLLKCAKSLVTIIKNIKLKNNKNINVYLLTDYPIYNYDIKQSQTFKYEDIKYYNHISIQYILDNINNITLSYSNNTPINMKNLKINNNLNFVSINNKKSNINILPIVDKIIAINSDYFIYGDVMCSKKSSYTKQIIEERKNINRSINYSFSEKYR